MKKSLHLQPKVYQRPPERSHIPAEVTRIHVLLRFADLGKGQTARMAESVDALVSNTSGREAVPVRPRLRVL